MITLKNNKLPRLHLKLKNYRIFSNNEFVTEYRKAIVLKDQYNYPEVYYIHIFYHKQDNDSDVCVSRQVYLQDEKEWGYNFYSGEHEAYSWDYIIAFDKKLLKFIEERKGVEVWKNINYVT